LFLMSEDFADRFDDSKKSRWCGEICVERTN
jgi:hypothetical protein